MPGKVPVTAEESLWQMPQASTLIRTSPGPGSGIGRSTSSSGASGFADLDNTHGMLLGFGP